MSDLFIKIHDVESNSVKERKMTEKEITSLLEITSQSNAVEDYRQSAFDKLTALGLTPEEIAAITGA